MDSSEPECVLENEEQPQTDQGSVEIVADAPEVQDTTAEVTEAVVLDGASANAAKAKSKRPRSHPVWDSAVPFEGRPIGDVRKELCLVQCNASNPWKQGKKGATWASITTELLKHKAFSGIELTSRAVEDRVTLWLDKFKPEDRGKQGATGTDDEHYGNVESLLTELLELKGSTEASNKQVTGEKEALLRKKNADAAGAKSLLESSAKGLASKEDARKTAKREFAKLNDNEHQLDAHRRERTSGHCEARFGQF
ncbi:hypothetical protein CYMTET_30945 [Cymbomonas tetramitiformis]|uniref:Uncharacterized protein n=1 Tax=Cymbomonas tetramitiformis TaxID=36881 RepID=A0AAE0FI43_9CHLO|nr:hypothetical protein CYMTET_30945 [Cymbomonas tetramitiformis]